jgi:Holliday junction DNA helicase RuvA
MIAIISGKVIDKIDDQIVVDCGGVGYGLLVTSEDYVNLNIGDFAKLYVYEHIREQSFDLFGFTIINTKKLFQLLLGVNGVGPKMALSLLSVGSADEWRW